MGRLNNFNLAIKQSEKSSVFLFFLHNFFIGIGSILIYTSANVILLENHPEFSLPLAYIVAATTMMLVGKIYEYFEHNLPLKILSIRVLIVASLLSALIVLATIFSHSMAVAIGIMVTFRVIYLLANLEFWGVSAVIFDVRQSKRLFSIIGSGDMPAKMLGAILAALIHSEGIIPILLTISMLMFIAALFTQRRVFQGIEIPPQQNHHRHEVAEFSLKKLFGRGELVLRMCLGFGAIAMIAIFVEYSFFINVKHKFHSQHEVTAFVGKIIAMTYFIGLIVKILVSRRVLEQIGLRKAIFILPIMALVLSAVLTILMEKAPAENLLLVYYCGYYLSFEVIRRTLFDPVFLIFFQPLNTHQRLKAHTLSKGFFEPLGIGVMGGVLLLMYYYPSLVGWFDFIFIAILAFTALFVFNAAYRSYVFVLNSAIKMRFMGDEDLSLKSEARKIYLQYLTSPNADETLASIEWFRNNEPNILVENHKQLLENEDEKIRLISLNNCQEFGLNLGAENILELLKKETNPALKHKLTYLFCKNHDASLEKIDEFLYSSDEAIWTGTILACGEEPQLQAKAKEFIENLIKSDKEQDKLQALSIINKGQVVDYQWFMNDSLKSESEVVRKKAIEIAEPNQVFELIHDGIYWKSVVKNLTKGHENIAELIQQKLISADSVIQQRLFLAVEKSKISQKNDLLITFTQKTHTRLRALKALVNNNAAVPTETIDLLIENEFKLAKHIFEGIDSDENKPLEVTLNEEIQQLTQRIFYALMLQHNKTMILNVMFGLQHLSKEKRANSLETLENSIPRNVYQRLQILIDDSSNLTKVETLERFAFDDLENHHLKTYILQKGDESFGDWTVALAIKHSIMNTENFGLISIYLNHPKAILSEIAYQSIEKEVNLKKKIKNLSMSHTLNTSHISTIERTIILKNTSLFAQTPENVLTTLAPIIQEVTAHEREMVFQKGDLGDSMYIIYSGEVGVFDGKTELARFKKYDFFGELALLDSETRSASIVALSDSLLFKINQEDFYELLEERPELMRNIIKALSQRIRLLNTKVSVK